MKRTPIEQAIAEKTDRQARYMARKQKAGFVRVTMYMPAGDAPLIRGAVGRLCVDHEAERTDTAVPVAERFNTKLQACIDQLETRRNSDSTDGEPVEQAEAA